MELQEIIMQTIERVQGCPVNTGGCRPFYSPEEWEERAEKYGRDSVLVVAHDGGDVASFFNYDYMDYRAIDAMNEALSAAGYYAEQCTSWYSAIYPIPKGA